MDEVRGEATGPRHDRVSRRLDGKERKEMVRFDCSIDDDSESEFRKISNFQL